MGFIVHLLKPFGRQVCIDLRGDQVRVSEQFLHTPQVGAPIQQVCGVAMSQLMRAEMGVELSDLEIAF